MDSRMIQRRGLYICAALFLAGGAFGAYRACGIDADLSGKMLEVCRSGLSARQAVLLNLALPCLAVFFSTSVIGFLFVPILDFAGGFAAAYIMTAILSASGRNFYTIVFLAAPALSGVLCQLMLSVSCIDLSFSVGREKRGTAGFGRLHIFFAAFAGLVILTAAEFFFYKFAR